MPIDGRCPVLGPSLPPTDNSALGIIHRPFSFYSCSGVRALHPLFLILTTVEQGKSVILVVELKTPQVQGDSDLPRVAQPVSVELGFQGQICWHSPSACYTSLVSQAGKNGGAF